MKSIQDIKKMSMAHWDRIGADESIPVPEDLHVQLPRENPVARWSIAAAVAILLGLGWAGYNRANAPKDTFSDPYLAYAAVKEALNKVSGNVQKASEQVSRAEVRIDQINYWK